MLVLLTSVALAVSVDQIPNPRDHGGWVTDLAEILPPEAEARLDGVIDALHRDLDAEIAVITVPSATGASPKELATHLFNRWGVGDDHANNGLVVLLVLDQRRLEMETGYGLEGVLPDGWLGAMQAERMVTAFRSGDYGAGIEAGLAAVDERMRQHPEDVRLGTNGPIRVAEREAASGAVRRTAIAVALGGGGCALLGGFVVAILVVSRRQQRTCDTCRVYMPVLDEAAEDEHLDPGQQTEERIGSVDWRVHQCPTCRAVRTFPSVRWLSGYTTCGVCGHRARETQTVTEVHATQFSGGRVRITEQCRHCGNRAAYTRRTPALPTVVVDGGGSGGGYSGGGGGGSFGGGSSGGGGAGSSW